MAHEAVAMHCEAKRCGCQDRVALPTSDRLCAMRLTYHHESNEDLIRNLVTWEALGIVERGCEVTVKWGTRSRQRRQFPAEVRQ